MLTVLGGLAEFERELIRSRTDEGRIFAARLDGRDPAEQKKHPVAVLSSTGSTIWLRALFRNMYPKLKLVDEFRACSAGMLLLIGEQKVSMKSRNATSASWLA